MSLEFDFWTKILLQRDMVVNFTVDGKGLLAVFAIERLSPGI